MDAALREQWKWTFYYLALHLNAVILCIALTVIAVLKAPEPYRIPGAVVLVVLDILLVLAFRRRYDAAKTWLDEHATSKKDSEPAGE